MATILSAGSILIERQYFVDHIPQIGQVSIATKSNTLVSGKVINAARILTLHNKVYFAGTVGMDENGNAALVQLKNYGFYIDFINQTTNDKTGEVVVTVDSTGNPAITLFLGASKIRPADSVYKELVKNLDFIYTETSSLDSCYKLIQVATENKVPIFLDVPNHQVEFDKNYLKNVAFLAPNREEAELLLGSHIISIEQALQAATELKKYTNGNVIVSLDKDGCVVFEAGSAKPYHVETKKIVIKDATGAGDIFRAVLLNQYIKTRNLRKSIDDAIFIASASTQMVGVDASIAASRQMLQKRSPESFSLKK